MNHLVLDLKYHWAVFGLAIFKPVVTLNGYPVPVAWGRNVIPVAPGAHHLHVHIPGILPPQVGKADLQVWVAQGQSLPVEYRAPVWSFSPGALGRAPQPWNGLVYQLMLLGALLVPLAFILVLLGAVLVSIAN
ncbi:hypothetical protein ACFSKW_32325 [Nonomuraea mangrovi]|uniref:Uncharacterized protein n=1 Tax=Nonomuraea mangrovi TaxID=2316207 RepID=A0ABW4T2J8_9ACTN